MIYDSQAYYFEITCAWYCAHLSSMVNLCIDCHLDVLLCNRWNFEIGLMHLVGNVLLKQLAGKSFVVAWYDSFVATILHAFLTAVFIEIAIKLTRMLVRVPSCIRRIAFISIWFHLMSAIFTLMATLDSDSLMGAIQHQNSETILFRYLGACNLQ